MEIDIGKHCYICGINTFTPFKCNLCNSKNKNYFFCKHHINNHIHKNIPCSTSDERKIVKKQRQKKIKRCYLENCNQKITIMNFQCYYCKKEFCLNHQLPEVHVCQSLCFQNSSNEH